MSEFEGYSVKRIRGGVGRDFIRDHHYTKSCHNGPMCWGLFRHDEIIGVIAFANPSSEAVRSQMFGVDYKHTVTELHRLFISDTTPKNAESWFIVRALKELKKVKPELNAVISFADSTEGHVGTIYQATNALFCGTTGRARFWRDSEGRLRHPRQNGVNIDPYTAKQRGWKPEMREAKNRYVFIVGNRKWFKSNFKLTALPYPKKSDTEEV